MARCRDCEALERQVLRLEGRVIALEAWRSGAVPAILSPGMKPIPGLAEDLAIRWREEVERQRKRREEKEAAELASRPTGDELTEAERAGAGDAWMNE